MNNDLSSTFPNLQLLKLGGSLITDKTQPHTPRKRVIARLSEEISFALLKHPEMQLIIGHGAGSFAHVPAKFYGTRQGVQSKKDWHGFMEVWQEAVSLNRLVMESLRKVGLPAISFPPSASLTTSGGKVHAWNLDPLKSALIAGLIPVIYGDVIFDHQIGGTILSTEDLFMYLARYLQPARILLAGMEPGVWADYPTCTTLLTQITPQNLDQITTSLGESNATDVTGGMASKVIQMVELLGEVPNLKILIFSGKKPDYVVRALLGDEPGTIIVDPAVGSLSESI
jgi:isopentenyl phosphate kinase